jgi:AcrR family transcriptional regulator
MSEPERRRLAESMIDLVIADGYDRVTVQAVCERAGLSRAAFDRHFSDLEDCYLRLFDRFTDEFDRATFGAYEATRGSWRERLRAAAYGAARYIRDHPRESTFSSTLMFAAGDLAQAHRERHLRRLVALVDAGRSEQPDPGALGRPVAEAAVGSIYSLVTKRLAEGAADSVEALVPELMYLATRPYLGEERAREELAIPPPPESGAEG